VNLHWSLSRDLAATSRCKKKPRRSGAKVGSRSRIISETAASRNPNCEAVANLLDRVLLFTCIAAFITGITIAAVTLLG